MWWVYAIAAGIYLFGIALFFLFRHTAEFDVIEEYFPCQTRTESILYVLNLLRNIIGIVLCAWMIGYLFAMAVIIGICIVAIFWIFGFEL